MPELTPKLGIKKPLGNERVSRASFNENWDIIDQNAASQEQVDQPFFLKSATYDSANNRLVLTFGKGRANFLGTLVAKTIDTTYYINAPTANTSYYIYVKSNGTFIHNTTGGEVDGAVVLWKVTTGASVNTITTTDLRGQLPGAAAQVVKDQLDAHIAAADPHPQYATDTDLSNHKNAAVLDHPDGSVTDAKIGTRSADPAQAPTSNGPGTLTQWLNWITNRIKAITGNTNWYDAPVATIKAVWDKFNASSGHKHTGGPNDAPPIPITGIDSAAKTTAGGSEPNRLAVTNAQGRVGDSERVGGQTLANLDSRYAPASHVGAGGSAHATATPTTAGFMSAADKAKLDGIQAGAEVNQNAFSNVKVGSTTIAADSKTDTLELVAGTGVVLTPDATNDKVTIAANATSAGGTEANKLAMTNASGRVGDSEKLAGYLPTTAGGTEANRVAVTDSNGRVGDANKLGGYNASDYPRKAEAATVTQPWTFDTHQLTLVSKGKVFDVVKKLGATSSSGRWIKVARIQNANPIDGSERTSFFGTVYCQEDFGKAGYRNFIAHFAFASRTDSGSSIIPVFVKLGDGTQAKFAIYRHSDGYHWLYFYQPMYSDICVFYYATNSPEESWTVANPPADATLVWDSSNTSHARQTMHTGPIKIDGNTVWHAGNDGAGSGLDADLLDGYQTTSPGGTEATRVAVTDSYGRVGDSSRLFGIHGLDFVGLRPAIIDEFRTVNFNTHTNTGFYYIDLPAGGSFLYAPPSVDTTGGILCVYNGDNFLITQVYFPTNGVPYFRTGDITAEGISWNPWKEILTQDSSLTESWKTATLQNGWQNYGGSFAPARYRKDRDGTVYLGGLVKGGPQNSVIFTLPVGYRPAYSLIFATMAYSSTTGKQLGRIAIKSNGEVWCDFGPTDWVSLDTVRFKAEQ